jgi:hypothetical protein
MTKLLNAGLLDANACGNPPLAVSPAPVATRYGGASTDSVALTWPASLDQDVGEQDVQFYMVYRRPTGTTDWGNPATSVAAGSATYRWIDPSAPNLHGTYEYNVIAQDCTPTNSGDAISNSVVLP